MKQHLLSKALFVLMTMLMVSTKMHAQEPYAVLNDDNTVLTFYYDGQKTIRDGMDVGPFTYYKVPAWRNVRDYITTVVFDDSFVNCASITSTANWFQTCHALKTIIGIKNLKTDNVTDMQYMFAGCTSLTSLDLSSFNTDKVTSMYGMFNSCSSLTSLDLSTFNTAKVELMGWMFYNCNNLTSLNLSSFNTTNVTRMDYMFHGCSSLTSLDVSNFNTANVTVMEYMFSGCSSLTILDLRNFNTVNVSMAGDMFSGCSSLTNLDLSSFNTAKMAIIGGMFYGCSNLTSLDLSSFNTSKAYNMGWLFRDCSKLTTIYVSELWNTESVTNYSALEMFSSCTNLVGGKGTKYDSNHTDYTYARIDGGEDAPGYFTYKATSGIKGMTRDADLQHARAYNLRGQRLTEPQRGINIIGGKKVVVK